MDEFVRRFLNATADVRSVIADPTAGYFGVPVDDRTLTPGDHPLVGPTHFDGWLRQSGAEKASHA